jgi:hypothetical protein
LKPTRTRRIRVALRLVSAARLGCFPESISVS